MKIYSTYNLILFVGIVVLGSSCGKKTKTFPATNGSAAAPEPAPATPPPAVNWNNNNQVDNLTQNPNLCYVSASNYFAGQSYVQVAEPVYGTYYDYCAGYYRYYFQGYYYYFAPSGNCQYGPPQVQPPQPQPPVYHPPKPQPPKPPSNSCGGSSKSYDSDWVPMAKTSKYGYDCKVTSGSCNSDCRGNNSQPADYIDYGGLHSFQSCTSQSSGDKFGVWGERNTALGLNSSNGAVILYKGSSVEIEIDSADLKGSQDYYLSIDAKYTGCNQTQELMEVSVNGKVVQNVKDLHDSNNSEKWKSCYIKTKICLKSGKNHLRFKGPKDSVHMDAYRLSSSKPSGLSPCP